MQVEYCSTRQSRAVAACKIDVDVPAGGSVTTNSGSLSCSANSSCTLDVADIYFDETFVANPATGFDFIGWKSGPARLCAGSTEPCRFSTAGLAGNEDAIALLDDPNLLVYLEPAFVSESAEPEELLGTTFSCPWDESDPTLHGVSRCRAIKYGVGLWPVRHIARKICNGH